MRRHRTARRGRANTFAYQPTSDLMRKRERDCIATGWKFDEDTDKLFLADSSSNFVDGFVYSPVCPLGSLESYLV